MTLLFHTSHCLYPYQDPLCSSRTHFSLYSLFSMALSPIFLHLCYSLFFSLETCLTLGCFFLRPSTPLPATQYFQFTLLLSNLPLHSSHALFHYLLLSSFAFCPPLAVGFSEPWIQGFSISIHSITHMLYAVMMILLWSCVHFVMTYALVSFHSLCERSLVWV